MLAAHNTINNALIATGLHLVLKSCTECAVSTVVTAAQLLKPSRPFVSWLQDRQRLLNGSCTDLKLISRFVIVCRISNQYLVIAAQL